MLATIVQYLRSHGVPFRLSSQPSPEPRPAVAEPFLRGSQSVQTQVLLVGTMPAIACFAPGSRPDLARLEHELGVAVREGSPSDLPASFAEASEPIPPLGGAFGALVIVDESLIGAPAITFAAFSSSDWFELSYDQFALLERPRVASFAIGGELPEHPRDERPAERPN